MPSAERSLNLTSDLRSARFARSPLTPLPVDSTVRWHGLFGRRSTGAGVMSGERLRVVAAAGLVIGALLGMAGSFAPTADLRGLAWGVDGIAIVVGGGLPGVPGGRDAGRRRLRDGARGERPIIRRWCRSVVRRSGPHQRVAAGGGIHPGYGGHRFGAVGRY